MHCYNITLKGQIAHLEYLAEMYERRIQDNRNRLEEIENSGGISPIQRSIQVVMIGRALHNDSQRLHEIQDDLRLYK